MSLTHPFREKKLHVFSSQRSLSLETICYPLAFEEEPVIKWNPLTRIDRELTTAWLSTAPQPAVSNPVPCPMPCVQNHDLICMADHQQPHFSFHCSDFLLCYFWFLWDSQAILLHWLTQSWFPSCYKLPSFAFRLFNCSEWVPSLPEAAHTSLLETLWMKPVSARPALASLSQTSVTHARCCQGNGQGLQGNSQLL